MSIGIWNNIDELALYLGLKRLDGETNDEFANRIKVFPRWKYRTDYYTQVHSIPLQAGLKTEVIGRIVNLNNNKYECDIAWDYLVLKEILADGSTGEYIRVFLEGKGDSIKDVSDRINSSSAFRCNIYYNNKANYPLAFLVRNNNVKLEVATTDGKYSNLGRKDIVKGSVRVDSPSYRRLVSSISALSKPGDFYVDYSTGFIQTYDASPDNATVSFRYYDQAFALELTELNLIPVNRFFSYGITDDSINLIPYLLNNIVAGE